MSNRDLDDCGAGYGILFLVRGLIADPSGPHLRTTGSRTGAEYAVGHRAGCDLGHEHGNPPGSARDPAKPPRADQEDHSLMQKHPMGKGQEPATERPDGRERESMHPTRGDTRVTPALPPATVAPPGGANFQQGGPPVFYRTGGSSGDSGTTRTASSLSSTSCPSCCSCSSMSVARMGKR